MKSVAILFIFGMPAVASAADLSVNDEDQRNIQVLCETAAKSPLVSIEQTALMAQFCVQWKARVQEAAKPVADKPKVLQPEAP